MRGKVLLLALAFGVSLVLLAVQPAAAHRPYFEEEDISAQAPWEVDDPTISTAIYATLESAEDVDYYTFQGEEGQSILLALTIPQIEGQDDFAPSLALIGPGLPSADLPARVASASGAQGTGAMVIPPPSGPAPTFHEPFSGTSYWDRQEERVSLPTKGRFVVAVWHPDGAAGRYTFVIGEQERLGGDLAFPLKMRRYWTPVEAPAVGPTSVVPASETPSPTPTPAQAPAKRGCG